MTQLRSDDDARKSIYDLMHFIIYYSRLNTNRMIKKWYEINPNFSEKYNHNKQNTFP